MVARLISCALYFFAARRPPVLPLSPGLAGPIRPVPLILVFYRFLLLLLDRSVPTETNATKLTGPPPARFRSMPYQSALRVRAAAALGAMLQLVHERQSTPKYSRLVLDKIEEGWF